MSALVLLPTELAQWHALVNEAQQRSALSLDEDLQAYLVFLLMRHTQNPELIQTRLVSQYLHSQLQKSAQAHHTHLQQLGDTALLLSGLFPKQAERRHVSVPYFISMGQWAYQALGESLSQHDAALFQALSQHFLFLFKVLWHLRIEETLPLPAAVAAGLAHITPSSTAPH